MCFDNDDDNFNTYFKIFFYLEKSQEKKTRKKQRINVGLAPENKEKENEKRKWKKNREIVNKRKIANAFQNSLKVLFELRIRNFC